MQDVIILKNLKKTFANGVKAVNGIDLNIQKGEVFGFLGPNGAGKSTSMDMMTGLLKPSSGEIRFPEKSSIGYVPQKLVFYEHLSCYENLRLFADCYEVEDSENRIDDVIKALMLDEIRNRNSAKLSGGQKRRLNIAIGLLISPDILFLDEPSAGMDPQSRNILWNLIESLSSNMTIVITTHLMEVADRLSDRVAIIDSGVVQVVDRPEKLKNMYGDGDILEIEFKEDVDTSRLNFNEELKYTIRDNMLHIQSLDIVNIIPYCLDQIKKQVGESAILKLQMRENTLEDVFISLTGSSLREEFK